MPSSWRTKTTMFRSEVTIRYESPSRVKKRARRLGFGDWVQSISALSPDSLSGLAVKCLDEGPSRRSDLIDAVLREQRSASDGARLLRAALDDPSAVSASWR